MYVNVCVACGVWRVQVDRVRMWGLLSLVGLPGPVVRTMAAVPLPVGAVLLQCWRRSCSAAALGAVCSHGVVWQGLWLCLLAPTLTWL